LAVMQNWVNPELVADPRFQTGDACTFVTDDGKYTFGDRPSLTAEASLPSLVVG